MSNRNAANILIIMAVVAIVAGAAWFKTQRSQSPASEMGAAAAAPTAQPAEIKLPGLVDLGADKCIPCKKMAPILKELRAEYAGRATVHFIDVWKNPSAERIYGIRIIPTQIFYDREGNEVWRHEGFLSKAAIVAKFKELGVK